MRKNSILYPIVMIFFITSCFSDKFGKGGLPFIDVRKKYPEKEILLTDIADVTYLHLSTANDDYLFSGWINCITENTIVVVDNVSNSILFFSKDGNPKSRFNHYGQGPEDYLRTNYLIYDETADELFICYGRNAIKVYSSTGIYKRKITLPEGITITDLIDFDDRSLFFYDWTIERDRSVALSRRTDLPAVDKYVIPFYRISKTTGEILDYVELPSTQLSLGFIYDGRWISAAPRKFSAQSPEGVLLWSPGTDTVFLYSGDKPLTPVLYQTPSLVSLNPKEILGLCLDRGQYQFIQIFTIREGNANFPAKYYMRNKKTGEIVRQKFILPDYRDKEFVISGLGNIAGKEYKNGYLVELFLDELKQAYRENKLGGNLKELVATLNEDEDYTVFMLVEFK